MKARLLTPLILHFFFSVGCGSFSADALKAAEPSATATPITLSVGGDLQSPYPDTGRYDFEQYRIGSYGEMLGTFKDYGINRFYGNSKGNTKRNHNEMSIPRFVIQGEYKISPKWILSAELEIESGGTGITYEIEAQSGSENGEYEMEVEKGGEVALEQFHLTRLVTREFNMRMGHIILPIGPINAHHEPLNFFTAARPEGATTIIASTWHETGVEFFGQFGNRAAMFHYQALITSGLNPNGFDAYNWVKKAKQGFLEVDNFSAPAYSARLDWKSVPGLRIGASALYNPKAQKNADKLVTYAEYDDINVLLYSIDAQYVNRYVTARASYLTGNITETVGITAANRRYSSKSPYSRMGPVAKRAIVYPFAHYNYYNPQEECETGLVADKRCQISMWSVGLNWKILPNLVAKADYTTRQIGTSKIFGSSDYNSENEFRIGIAYQIWFAKK